MVITWLNWAGSHSCNSTVRFCISLHCLPGQPVYWTRSVTRPARLHVIRTWGSFLNGNGNKNYFFIIRRDIFENQLRSPFTGLHYLLYFLRYLRTKMTALRHLGHAYLSPNMHDVTTGVKSVFIYSNYERLWYKFSKYLNLTISQIKTLAMYSFQLIFWLSIVIFINVYQVVMSLN